jgi:hypothetical protein
LELHEQVRMKSRQTDLMLAVFAAAMVAGEMAWRVIEPMLRMKNWRQQMGRMPPEH